MKMVEVNGAVEKWISQRGIVKGFSYWLNPSGYEIFFTDKASPFKLVGIRQIDYGKLLMLEVKRQARLVIKELKTVWGKPQQVNRVVIEVPAETSLKIIGEVIFFRGNGRVVESEGDVEIEEIIKGKDGRRIF